MPSAQVLVVPLLDSLVPLEQVLACTAGQRVLVPVVCVVPPGNMPLAVAAARAGALDVLTASSCGAHDWAALFARLPARLPSTYVFADPDSRKLLALTERVAQAAVTVLLTGPTGAGKEVLARIIHEASPRREGAFVALNCAALPESLAEDILFGHERGAFTGAHRPQAGVFEQADGGTLFLDEIGELPLPLQAKLLRVLQDRTLVRLGGRGEVSVDVRLVAATNRDLVAAIRDKGFREDLYFRISTFRLNVPPLCERRGDIVPLALHMLNTHGQCTGGYSLTERAQKTLLQHPWPGNVRELENVMQRALILSGGASIDDVHLMFDQLDAVPAVATQALPSTASVLFGAVRDGWINPQSLSDDHAPALSNAVRHSEHQAIMAAIKDTPNRRDAARKLGISPRTLRYKLARLRELGLECTP